MQHHKQTAIGHILSATHIQGHIYIMLSILVAVFTMHFVAAKPLDDLHAETIFYENLSDGYGNYRYAYQTTNGIALEQVGELVTDHEADLDIVVKGFYSFIAPDNSVHEVRYVSDKNGYRPYVYIKSSVSSSDGTNFDLNRHSETNTDKYFKSTTTIGEMQKTESISSQPCIPSTSDKNSTTSTPVQKEASTGDSLGAPTIPCLPTITDPNKNVTFDERLGKAVMISILGKGG